jgi:pyridoxamine 5'-phosphate oxidase
MSQWPPDHLAGLRLAYDRPPLREGDLPAAPGPAFAAWFADAEAAGVVEPNAMVLGTVGTDGVPASRTVLLKGLTGAGFVFYTNTRSRKGRQLAARPWASLLFPWYPLFRQVIVQGAVGQVAEAEADAYVGGRPVDSQLGAWASRQSAPVAGRAELEASLEQARERFGAGPVPRPPYWSGYEVRPVLVEFWQGQPSRLHDRLVFVTASGEPAPLADATAWRLERWSP